jgi:hypothetical protein
MNTERSAVTYEDALKAFAFYFKQQPDLAWSWHCNIAMLAVDAGAPHLEANMRTADFMRRAFDIDVTSFNEYKAVIEQATKNLENAALPKFELLFHRDHEIDITRLQRIAKEELPLMAWKDSVGIVRDELYWLMQQANKV